MIQRLAPGSSALFSHFRMAQNTTAVKSDDYVFNALKAAKTKGDFKRTLRDVAGVPTDLADYLAAGHKFSQHRDDVLEPSKELKNIAGLFKKFKQEVSETCQIQQKK